jgi:hypothetical protein
MWLYGLWHRICWWVGTKVSDEPIYVHLQDETSIATYRTTWCYNPWGHNINLNRRKKNLKTYTGTLLPYIKKLNRLTSSVFKWYSICWRIPWIQQNLNKRQFYMRKYVWWSTKQIVSVRFGVITNDAGPVGCSLTYEIGETIFRNCTYK